MAAQHARKWRERQRRTTRFRWLLVSACFVLLILFLARHYLLQRRAAGGSQPANPSLLDVVRQRALEAPLPPGATLDAWRVVVLVPASAEPAWSRPALEVALQKVVQPMAVEWHAGESGTTLAAYLGVESLPGAVLIPPFCRQAQCEPPAIWQPWQRGEVGAAPGEALAAWLTSVASAWLLLANDLGELVTFTQRLPDGNTTSQAVEPGGRSWLSSPLQAEWTASTGEDGGGPVLVRRTVRGDGIMTARKPGECNFFLQPGCEVPRPDKQFSQKTIEARSDADQGRKDDIRNQSATIRKYTKVGFEKRAAPPALFAALHSWFQAHAGDYIREDWDDEDIFVNHDKAQFLLVDFPDDGPMRPAIFELLRPIFEAWAGGIALRGTAIYGVRVYTRGCVLQDHVDVPETHHVSAILNIDQDVNEPWPLEVFDHDGVAHQATLRPGEMLLYEGATCAHGRPTPLNGKFLANVFIHFAPATA